MSTPEANTPADLSAPVSGTANAEKNADAANSIAVEAAANAVQAELDALKADLAKAQAEAAQFKDEFLRARAESENIRRRSAEDVLKANKFGIERFARDLLSVTDSLDAALAAPEVTLETLKSGVEITQRQLAGVLERNAIVPVVGAGEKFDPNIHMAIAQVPSDQPANTVVAVMQKGYKLHDRCLRPSMVTVSTGQPAPAAGATDAAAAS
jgi:molecular chaperone GrpE